MSIFKPTRRSLLVTGAVGLAMPAVLTRSAFAVTPDELKKRGKVTTKRAALPTRSRGSRCTSPETSGGRGRHWNCRSPRAWPRIETGQSATASIIRTEAASHWPARFG